MSMHGQMWLWSPLLKFTNFWRFTLEPWSIGEFFIWKKKFDRKLLINSYRFHVTGYYIIEFAPVSFQWYFRFPNATKSQSISISQYYLHTNITHIFKTWQHNMKSKISDSSTSPFVTDGSMLWTRGVTGGWYKDK